MPETSNRSAQAESSVETGATSSAAVDPSGASTAMQKPHPIRSSLPQLQLGRFSGVFIFVGIFCIFALWVPDSFLTASTWKTIAQGQAITAFLAIAILFPLAAGAFDLSAAQNMGFSALVCGALMSREPHLDLVPAVAVTLLIGASIGALNGFLVGIVRLDSFIATLGTTSLLVGAAAIVGNGEYLGPLPAPLTSLASGSLFGIPVLAVYVMVIALFCWYVLEHTPLGRRVYATGANRDAARLAGIRTTRFTFWSFVICGTGASLAGVLLASNLNTVNQSLGPQYLLPAFAAAFLGTTQLKPGRFNVWGTVLAICLLGTGVQGLQLAGADLWVTDVFNGVALIGAISIALLMQRLRGKREVKAAETSANHSSEDAGGVRAGHGYKHSGSDLS